MRRTTHNVNHVQPGFTAWKGQTHPRLSALPDSGAPRERKPNHRIPVRLAPTVSLQDLPVSNSLIVPGGSDWGYQ